MATQAARSPWCATCGETRWPIYGIASRSKSTSTSPGAIGGGSKKLPPGPYRPWTPAKEPVDGGAAVSDGLTDKRRVATEGPSRRRPRAQARRCQCCHSICSEYLCLPYRCGRLFAAYGTNSRLRLTVLFETGMHLSAVETGLPCDALAVRGCRHGANRRSALDDPLPGFDCFAALVWRCWRPVHF